MYRYSSFDRHFVHARSAQFRDQLQRHLAGELPEDDFKALRLQNGWYVQRHAPMLRVAVPYGELASHQLRQLARIARELDDQGDRGGFAHFTTRQNVQFNWIPLARAADAQDLLAGVDMHGIQTSGNCIRNITTDALAGIAPDERIDPRPYCEILRQWSTLHPEFAFLPRKFKIAVSGADEDRAATAWHDIGLHLRSGGAGEVGFQVRVGGGMGRTPVIGTVFNDFVPWQQILVYIEAVVRSYNLHGRRDNLYKARIKILVKAEGQRFIDQVNAEFAALLPDSPHLIPQAEFDRVAACFGAPPLLPLRAAVPEGAASQPPRAYSRWLERNVQAHKLPGMVAVTLSLKRAGLPPGDVTAEQMDRAAELADTFSHGELRVTHDQNLLLPWVAESDLRALWLAAREDGFATPNIGLLTDMIACPGGDLCALANARSIPIAAAINERFDDIDLLHDIGDIDLHISGCINSCGHHHSGHIGILGVDKDGSEWYQVTLGGSDGSILSGAAVAGKVIGPSFAADEVPDVLEAVIDTYRRERRAGEHFVDTARRLGTQPFRAAADAVRRETAAATVWKDRLKNRMKDRIKESAMQIVTDDDALPAGALVLANDADVLADPAAVAAAPVVVLHFPKWTDGRAYSQAVLLRGRLRYAGAIRASGDVLIDMLPLLRCCGFDAVRLRDDQNRDSAERTLDTLPGRTTPGFPGHYQGDAAGSRPGWA